MIECISWKYLPDCVTLSNLNYPEALIPHLFPSYSFTLSVQVREWEPTFRLSRMVCDQRDYETNKDTAKRGTYPTRCIAAVLLNPYLCSWTTSTVETSVPGAEPPMDTKTPLTTRKELANELAGFWHTSGGPLILLTYSVNRYNV